MMRLGPRAAYRPPNSQATNRLMQYVQPTIQPPDFFGAEQAGRNAFAQRNALAAKVQTNAQNAATQASAEQRKADIQKLGALAGALYGVQTPEDYARAEANLVQMGVLTQEDAAKYNFGMLPQILGSVRGLEGQISDEQDLRDFEEARNRFNADFGLKVSEAARRANEPADEYGRYRQEELAAGREPLSRIQFSQAKQKSTRFVSDGDGGFEFYDGPNGGAPFGKKVVNQLETDFANSATLLTRMDRIGGLAGIDPETGRRSEDAARMLTYRGQGEDWLATVAEKAGVPPSEAQRQAIELRTRFTTSVEQLFNAYRKEITGAAAAVQALERLKKSFLTVDMSPAQFEAAYSEYRRELMRAMRVSVMLRRQGIDPRSGQGGDAFDRAFLGGMDDNWERRGEELEANGVGGAEILETLRREGYEPE